MTLVTGDRNIWLQSRRARRQIGKTMHEAFPATAFGVENIESIRTVDEVWLLGQPPLSDYLDFVRRWVIGGAREYRAALIDEWRAANDYYHELEQAEAGIADRVEC